MYPALVTIFYLLRTEHFLRYQIFRFQHIRSLRNVYISRLCVNSLFLYQEIHPREREASEVVERLFALTWQQQFNYRAGEMVSARLEANLLGNRINFHVFAYENGFMNRDKMEKSKKSIKIIN